MADGSMIVHNAWAREDFTMETTFSLQAVEAAEDRPAVPQHTSVETILNMTPENKEHFQFEKEAIFLLLTGIGDEIYSTVDACNTANEMWIAIERLQQVDYRNNFKLQQWASECSISLTTTTRMQFQLEVNDIRAERIAKSANTLALIAATQPYSDITIKHPKTSRSNATSSSTRPMIEQVRWTGNAKEFGLLGKFGNHRRTMTVAGAGNMWLSVVQQTGIQCFNCKGYGHYAKECRKPKRVKDYAYDKEKMMTCKQAEQASLQTTWLKIRRVSPKESSSTGQPLEQKDDSNVTPDSSNICKNDNQVDQNAVECVDERDALANLIANLTLDTEENKMILKQLKKANDHDLRIGKKFAPEREETMTLENESRSKLNKDKVKPYDYTNQNSLYEIFKGPSLEYLYQLERAKEVRKTMWRKPVE
ncbi:retrovirus-related pol polyprotein from transposon TNT 1-94 [Tanacetum coccineum]